MKSRRQNALRQRNVRVQVAFEVSSVRNHAYGLGHLYT